MGLIIVSLIFFIILAVLCFKDDGIGAVIMFIVVGILVSVAMSLLAGLIGCVIFESEYDYHDDSEKQIVSMQDNVFIYRRSTSKLIYTYAYKDGDGIRTGNVDADNSIIMYDNSDAKMITQKGNFKNWWHWLYALPTRDRYIFYVPQGTVKEEYNIDLKG